MRWLPFRFFEGPLGFPSLPIDSSNRDLSVTLALRALAVELVLLPLAGCGSPDVVAPTAGKALTPKSSAVSAATWTDGPWPFTIEGGELTCIGPADDPGVFIVTDAGDTFALNPAAIGMADQVGAIADLDPIWRWRDPDLPNAKVNVSPLILYALQLC